jgi:hypothetical protein
LLLLAGRGGRGEEHDGEDYSKVWSPAGHGGEGGTALLSPVKSEKNRVCWCHLLKGFTTRSLSLSGHGGEGRRRGDAELWNRRR